MEKRIIELDQIYKTNSSETAKLNLVKDYTDKILEQAGEGNIILLTGPAPIWLYLKAAHALHGKAKKLLYSAPGQGIEDFIIFDHDPD